ncbi:MAG: MFS transporter [Pseudomonadales bacterium]|nr:MFS transporter [Pseudomonadales bacterium]
METKQFNLQLSRQRTHWQKPEILLMLMAIGVPLSFSTWMALLNNFVIEQGHFTGAEIGLLQSLREVPGFLAFTAVFLLLIFREQTFALLSLAALGAGVALTGFFPSTLGLYCTTVFMSVGFHYYETMQTSLSLQWLPKDKAPAILGKIVAASSFASILAYGLIWLTGTLFDLPFKWVYLLAGVSTVFVALLCFFLFPKFPEKEAQHKHLVLRKNYWLYYSLTFLGGARRQIFVVFAGFMMVEKFGYSVSSIALLFLANHVINLYAAPKIGAMIGKIGERNALTLEYCGLIILFIAYAFVENANIAAGLYIIDHLFFSMAIAIKTYFQKIVDPKDIASSAGVSFSINHIAAVIIPALLGILWLSSPTLVFLVGSGFACCSLILARNIPQKPDRSTVARWGNVLPR